MICYAEEYGGFTNSGILIKTVCHQLYSLLHVLDLKRDFKKYGSRCFPTLWLPFGVNKYGLIFCLTNFHHCMGNVDIRRCVGVQMEVSKIGGLRERGGSTFVCGCQCGNWGVVHARVFSHRRMQKSHY